MSEAAAALRTASEGLTRWLLDQALPIWWSRAADRDAGGWRDQIAQDGGLAAVNRRARVQARQTYVYALAGGMGWDGPWREAAEHGLAYLDRHYRDAEGLYITAVTPEGRAADARALLYDQAFVLFAMAELSRARPGGASLEPQARSLLAAIRTRFAHPEGGFREADAERPFQSNPHMHLLEAALAWAEVGVDPAWAALADDIAALCLARFIDPTGGVLREFFEADWRPASGQGGREVWPGHQFEWCWLLERWGRLRGRADARAAARRLFEIGRDHGVDPARNVAINALLDDFSVHDPVARLWPQTERLKAALILAEAAFGGPEREALVWEAVRAAEGLAAYFRTPIPGLWYDRLDPDGRFIEDPAPASSLYHIACAIAELRAACERISP